MPQVTKVFTLIFFTVGTLIFYKIYTNSLVQQQTVLATTSASPTFTKISAVTIKNKKPKKSKDSTTTPAPLDVYDVMFTYTDKNTDQTGWTFCINDTSSIWRRLQEAGFDQSDQFPQPVGAVSSNHVLELCRNVPNLYKWSGIF